MSDMSDRQLYMIIGGLVVIMFGIVIPLAIMLPYRPVVLVWQVGELYLVIDPGESLLQGGEVFERQQIRFDLNTNEEEEGWSHSCFRGLRFSTLPVHCLDVLAVWQEYLIIAFPGGKRGVRRECVEEITVEIPILAPGSIEWDARENGALKSHSVYIWKEGRPFGEGQVIHYVV